jgi:hypothetical protein
MKKQVMIALGLSLVSATGWAAPPLPDNLLQCTNRGFGLQKCKLINAQLGDSLIEDGQIYEGTMVVRYDFPCTGHSVQLGVKVGDATKFFVMGAADGLITLSGTGELATYDPSPEVTRTLTFNTACRLKVTSARLLPSTTSIQIWTLQAQSQARIVVLATDRFLIAQDFENLSTWNVDKLTNFRDTVQGLVDANPGRLNFVTMLNSVNDALHFQPPSATLDELRNAGLDVIAALRGELEQEVANAEHLVDRFERWQVVIDQTLADAVDDANETMNPH